MFFSNLIIVNVLIRLTNVQLSDYMCCIWQSGNRKTNVRQMRTSVTKLFEFHLTTKKQL